MLLRIFLPVLLCLPLLGKAQTFDTIRVMTYNLTNYGNNISPCTAANNGLTLKNPAFKTIMQYVKPDVLGVCEMNTNPSIAGSFLSNVLNTDGVNHFARSAAVAEPSGTITNVLFYNSEKLGLKFQSQAQTVYRLTHHFRLYLKTESLALGDTIWLNVLLCHLKAGTATQDVADRGSMALTIRNYLNNFPKKENCMIMGDFNVYRSSETAFQTLTSASPSTLYQFVDPINRVGTWTSNASFADVHTQCPRTDNNGGCYSGGGMDDRFDFIFMNKHLINDSAGLSYLSGTYKAIGNDGQHYNSNINSAPVNNSAPANVISALYLASDHLPVRADLKVAGNFLSPVKTQSKKADLALWFKNGKVFTEYSEAPMEIAVFDMNGKCCWKGNLSTDEDGSLPLPEFSLKGLKMLQVATKNGRKGSLRFLIP